MCTCLTHNVSHICFDGISIPVLADCCFFFEKLVEWKFIFQPIYFLFINRRPNRRRRLLSITCNPSTAHCTGPTSRPLFWTYNSIYFWRDQFLVYSIPPLLKCSATQRRYNKKTAGRPHPTSNIQHLPTIYKTTPVSALTSFDPPRTVRIAPKKLLLVQSILYGQRFPKCNIPPPPRSTCSLEPSWPQRIKNWISPNACCCWKCNGMVRRTRTFPWWTRNYENDNFGKN